MGIEPLPVLRISIRADAVSNAPGTPTARAEQQQSAVVDRHKEVGRSRLRDYSPKRSPDAPGHRPRTWYLGQCSTTTAGALSRAYRPCQAKSEAAPFRQTANRQLWQTGNSATRRGRRRRRGQGGWPDWAAAHRSLIPCAIRASKLLIPGPFLVPPPRTATVRHRIPPGGGGAGPSSGRPCPAAVPPSPAPGGCRPAPPASCRA